MGTYIEQLDITHHELSEWIWQEMETLPAQYRLGFLEHLSNIRPRRRLKHPLVAADIVIASVISVYRHDRQISAWILRC